MLVAISFSDLFSGLFVDDEDDDLFDGLFIDDEDDDDILKFSTRHINEIYIAENDKGRIDTVFRKFKLSARAAVQKFGDNVSNNIATKNRKDPYEEVEKDLPFRECQSKSDYQTKDSSICIIFVSF